MLHPEVKKILAEHRSEVDCPIRFKTPQQARIDEQEWLAKLPDPEPIYKVEAFKIPLEFELDARLYIPKYRKGKRLLVYFHGGGWVIGSIASADFSCRAIANRAGCLVLSIGYRLAPENPYPAAVVDAYSATKWAVANAEILGCDSELVSVGGESAGGNLAGVTALKSKETSEFKLAAQILIYPVCDYEFDSRSMQEMAVGYGLEREDMRWFWHLYATEQQAVTPYASPARSTDLSNLPRALIVTAEYDPLRDQGVTYAKHLKASGVEVEQVTYQGVFHSFMRYPTRLKCVEDVINRVAETLQR